MPSPKRGGRPSASDRWPLLQQLCAWPASLPKSWRHPWEGLDQLGQSIMRGPWGNRAARAASDLDPKRVEEFFQLVESLGIHAVRVQGLLGSITSRQYDRWKNRPSTRLPSDAARRIEFFLRIWEGLLALFHQDQAARKWLFQPKLIPPFDGLAPIDALSGPGTLHKFEAIASMFSSLEDPAESKPESPELDSPLA